MGIRINRTAGRSAVLIAAAASLALIRQVRGGEPINTKAAAGGAAAITSMPPAAAEHRYRIGAKVRLGLFSIGRDDVGGALMTWRSTGDGTALALLAGSEPNRLPGNVNRWAYVREEVRHDSAEVFTFRSDDASMDTLPRDHDEPPFNAGCASLTPDDVRTSVATVDALGATYRTFERVLDRLEVAPAKWSGRRIARPAGTEPGFLTAMQRLLSARVAGATRPGPVSYVFNNKLYDLDIRRVRALGRTTVGSRTFEQLTRVDLTIRNRTSGDLTKFAVTTVPDPIGVALPVQIFFQPSFWIVVELRLDERADVPHDPADDGSLLTRMRDICASATR